MMFLPRIGDEVLVEFVQGNPDQPVITGSFFNAVSTIPYALPGEQTKSTIKTRSSKGGGGANEIRFEDRKGSEQLMISTPKELLLTGQYFNLTAPLGIGIGVPHDPTLALKVNGTVAATSFQGSGAGLNNVPAAALTGTVPDAQLPANAALRSGGNSFTGPQVITSGSLRMSDQGIFFRGGSDFFHGLGWFGSGTFAGVNPDGPVLFGCSGGGLGSMCDAPYLALTWNSQGNVALDPTGANTGALTPGLTFGTSGKEGIASKRSAGGNQSGLDFYTAGTNRMSLTSSGSLGIGTNNPVRRVQIVDADGVSGSLQVGAAAAGANPKLIYFGDSDYVHVGENGRDDQLELKGIYRCVHRQLRRHREPEPDQCAHGRHRPLRWPQLDQRLRPQRQGELPAGGGTRRAGQSGGHAHFTLDLQEQRRQHPPWAGSAGLPCRVRSRRG